MAHQKHLFRRTSLAAAQRTDVTDTPKERQATWEMMVTVPTGHGSPGRMWGKSASSNELSICLRDGVDLPDLGQGRRLEIVSMPDELN